MKETIKGIKEALYNKGSFENEHKLIEICKEEFDLKQKITVIENTKWRLQNEKLAICQKIARIGSEKNKLFIAMGLKFVEPVNKEGEDE